MPRKPKKIDKNIGRNIARIRKAKGHSQQQIANFIGVTQPAFGNYERGEREVPLSTLGDLANLFDVPLSFLAQEIPENISDDDIKNNGRLELTALADGGGKVRDHILRLTGELSVSLQTLISIFDTYWFHIKGTDKVPEPKASLFLQMLSLQSRQNVEPNDVIKMIYIFRQTAEVFYNLMYEHKIVNDDDSSNKEKNIFSNKLSELIDEDGYFKVTDH